MLTVCQESALQDIVPSISATRPLSRGLERAFFTALLITGSLEYAERAIRDAISLSSCIELSADTFLERSIKASIAISYENGAPDRTKACLVLPPELRDVLHLPRPLRHSYVLCLLVGLPKEVCASLLRLTVQAVGEQMSAAVIALSRNIDRTALA